MSTRRVFGRLLAAAVMGCGLCGLAPADDVRTILAPTGTLRIGVYPGTTLSMARDARTGEVRGVTLEIGAVLARRLGVPFERVERPRLMDVLAGIRAGELDFTVSNASPARAADASYSPAVLSIELGYLVPAGSPVAAPADLARPGLRIGVTAGSSSLRSLPPILPAAVVVPAASLADGTTMLARGEIDAYATNKAILFEMASAMEGARVLDGRWGVEHVAIAIPKGREAAAAFIRDFVAEIRADGTVADAVRRSGLKGVAADE